MIRKDRNLIIRFAILVIVASSASTAVAIDHQSGTEPYQAIRAEPIPIEEASKTVLGQPYSFPAGTPLIQTFKITIEPGMKTGPHKHAIPLLAYVISGTLGVDYGSRGKRSFSAGEAYVEAIDWCHVGSAVCDKEVQIIGIYLGEQNPNEIKPKSCPALD